MAAIDDLANRVLKNQRHLRKWARREDIEAYRLYDRDMPEFPLAIDRYADWLHVQAFERRRMLADADLHAIREALADALGVPLPQVVIKLRRRQRGSSSGRITELCSMRWRELFGCPSSAAAMAFWACSIARSPMAWMAHGKPRRLARLMSLIICLVDLASIP